jgi:hypothetical protein
MRTFVILILTLFAGITFAFPIPVAEDNVLEARGYATSASASYPRLPRDDSPRYRASFGFGRVLRSIQERSSEDGPFKRAAGRMGIVLPSSKWHGVNDAAFHQTTGHVWRRVFDPSRLRIGTTVLPARQRRGFEAVEDVEYL